MEVLEINKQVLLPGIPLGIALIGWNKKWLTLSGAIAGFLLGSVIVLTGFAETLALLTFFVLGTLASKLSSRILEAKKKSQSDGKFKVISYEKDYEKTRGRNAIQVFATVTIPAVLCLMKIYGTIGNSIIISLYFAYFACNLADTLASEFGVLSKEEPILVTTFKKVPRGTDGAISFQGTLFSLLGGCIIGFCAVFSEDISMTSTGVTVLRYSLLGFVGCMLDSILGAIIQTKERMALSSQNWKVYNCLVNLLSGIFTLVVDFFFQNSETEAFFLVLAVACLTLLFISPIPNFLARKLLHIGISLVIFTASHVFQLRKFISIVALVVTFLALPQLGLESLWVRFDKKLENGVKFQDSGIFLFALVSGFMFYTFEARQAEAILFSMYFSDSIGSIVGYYGSRNSKKKLYPKAVVSKTLHGSIGFLCAQFAFQSSLDPRNIVGNLALSANLALVELLTGSLDNLFLPVSYIIFSGISTGYQQLFIFFVAALICHFVLFNNDSSIYTKGVHAFYKFSRPHTIIGTSLSLTVILILTVLNDLSMAQVWEFSDVILFGYLKTLLASLQANVFIVGLNQIYDVEIDIINKPYLPLASGEFIMPFSHALVFFSFLCSVLNAYYYGNFELFLTVLVGNIMGTIYSIDLPYLHWKRFPVLAASLIFMVRGGIIQIGFSEYARHLVHDHTSFQLQSCMNNKYIVFLTVFLTVFGVAIAMFKDIPDIAGDKKEGIKTFAVRFGARKVVNFVNFMLGTVYSMAALYWYREKDLYGCVGHLVIFVFLGNKLNNTIVKGKEAAASIRASYMDIWKAFYLEYIMIASMFIQTIR